MPPEVFRRKFLDPLTIKIELKSSKNSRFRCIKKIRSRFRRMPPPHVGSAVCQLYIKVVDQQFQHLKKKFLKKGRWQKSGDHSSKKDMYRGGAGLRALVNEAFTRNTNFVQNLAGRHEFCVGRHKLKGFNFCRPTDCAVRPNFDVSCKQPLNRGVCEPKFRHWKS
jgi:hypothetical protein